MACCTCRALTTKMSAMRGAWNGSRRGYSDNSDSPILTAPHALHLTPHANMDDSQPKPTWLERLGALLMREPEDREQLIELLRSSYERNLLDSDALSMIEGVLQVS